MVHVLLKPALENFEHYFDLFITSYVQSYIEDSMFMELDIIWI